MNTGTGLDSGQAPIESHGDRLRRTTLRNAINVELVSAFAGDRDMTEAESGLIRTHRHDRGNAFHSDLLYAISHHFFPPEIAAALWEKILSHKQLLAERLGRNTGITVATLDYLSNITDVLPASTLISEAYVSEIENRAMRDGMTGLFNYSTSYELLALDLKNHRRYGAGVSVILLDIDDFKAVNDRSGHQEGDRILIDLARTLTEQTRDSDVCCRVGGDEFLVILRNADMDETLEVAERIREKATGITCGGQPIAVSLGIALRDHANTTPLALMQAADRALYEAKVGGKNRIVSRGLAGSARGSRAHSRE